MTDKPDRFFLFEVKPNDNGALTAYETELNISALADNTLLEKLQKIIDDANLAQNNGVYRITADSPRHSSPAALQ